MNNNPVDYTVEILQCAPGTSVPQPGPVDITGYCLLDSSATINRAVERDLLSFKTGDMTLLLKNDDGFFDDLFAFFGPSDRWQLRLFRRGDIQFWGVLIGKGSIKFDRTHKTCEMTAYGLNRMLNDVSAESVARTVAAMTVTTATGGATSITLNSTSGLLPGDILHVTDQVNAEDITIKQVTSGTVCSLEAALAHSYAATSPVTLTTPFYRYKSITYLVTALVAASQIPFGQMRLSGSQFSNAAPTPVNITTLNLSAFVWGGMAERNGRTYVTLKIQGGALDGTYYQTDPSSDWVKEDATARPWIDWSRYFLESESGPDFVIRDFIDGLSAGPFGHTGVSAHQVGVTYRTSGNKTLYWVCTNHAPQRLESIVYTAEDTAGAPTLVSNIPTDPPAAGEPARGCEYDPIRNAVYAFWFGASGHFQYYDIGGAAWTDLAQSDDAGKSYYGPVYVPEKDYVLALRASSKTGPAFEIAAFRGKARLWVRPFPNVRIARDTGEGNEGYIYPTQTLRVVGGKMYCLVVSDGKVQLVRSGDEWLTYAMKSVANSTSTAIYFGTRVLGQYRIFSYSGSSPRNYLTAAPFYAGIISYADFTDLSVAQALKKLSILCNALFWVDDDSQVNFIARDLFDSGTIIDISDRVMSRIDDLIWDETAQFASVSGNSLSATSGDNDFAAEGISLESDFISNEAFAQALADSYAAFYTKKRALVEATIHDGDGHIYEPLDRVFLDGFRYLVYESDHDLKNGSVDIKLLEDA